MYYTLFCSKLEIFHVNCQTVFSLFAGGHGKVDPGNYFGLPRYDFYPNMFSLSMTGNWDF